jgi:Uncharacterized protein conserved in bacteria
LYFVFIALWHGVHELSAIASRWSANRDVAGGRQCLHDVCLVWPPEEHGHIALVHGGSGQLGHCAVRVSAAGAANRIGYTQFNVGQLKILQEVITLSVFVPFAVFYLDQPLKWDYLWAGLCMLGAVYFIFRSG